MPRQTLKRRADGRYRCKYKERYFYGETQAEALQAREEYKRWEAAGLKAAPTVRTYAAEWLPIHKGTVISKTYNDYASQVDALIDILGDMRLDEVKPSDIKRVYTMHYNGYSASTIKRARMLYDGIFDSAVADGYIRINPCKSDTAKPHKGTEGSHRAITTEERKLIHEVQHPFRAAIMTMLYAGLRRGEVLALHSSDLDFNRKTIYVHQAIRYDSNQPILTTPKTDAGTRIVPMFNPLPEELKDINGLVASNKDQAIMSDSSFSSAWKSYITTVECHINGVNQKRWYGLTVADREKNPAKYSQIIRLKKSGKEKEADELRLSDWKSFLVRPHDLRHSFCTMLRDAGVDIKQAMQWMGHEDEKMILKIYDHLSDERRQKSVEQVEKMLERGQMGGQGQERHSKSIE